MKNVRMQGDQGVLQGSLQRALRTAAALVAVSLAVALVAGCKSPGLGMSGYLRDKALNNATLEYNKLVRWQEWEKACEYLKLDAQAAFTEKMENQEETFRLTDFEIKDTRPGSDSKSATVRVLYRYYWLPSITEQKMTVVQRWKWVDGEKRWTIENPLALPKRKPEKPPAAAAVRAQAGRDKN